MKIANSIDTLRRDDDSGKQPQSGDGARGYRATQFLIVWHCNKGADCGKAVAMWGHCRLVSNAFVSEKGEVEWTMAEFYYCVCHTKMCSAAVD